MKQIHFNRILIGLLAVFFFQCGKFEKDERNEVIGNYSGNHYTVSLTGTSSNPVTIKVSRRFKAKMVKVKITEFNTTTESEYIYEANGFRKEEGGAICIKRNGDTLSYDVKAGVMSSAKVVVIKEK